MTRQSGAERHRAAHRALATTRAQLGAAVALATLVGLVVVPLAARADQGDQEWTAASRLLDDSFDAEGRLGQAPVGGPWTPWSSRGASLVADDGELQVDGLSGGSAFVLSARAARAADVLVSSTVSAAPSGGAYYAGTSARMQSDGRRYAATVTVRPSGEVVLTAERVTPSGTTGLGRATTRAPIGTPLRIDLQTTGVEPTRVRARVFAEGTAAPDWQVSADDTGAEAITAAGSVGIGGYLARAASDVDLSVDAVQAWALVPGGAGSDGGAVTPPATTSPTTAPASTGGPTPSSPAESSPAAPPATAPSTTATSTSAAPTTVPAGPTATPQASSTSAAPTGTPAVRPTTSDAGFQHPGVLVSADQLGFVRAQIAAGREPWTSSLARTRSSSYAKSTWTPRPVAQVQCGAYNNPNIGCTAETDDAQAAYTNALLFSLTGERRYADKAVQILDAWSGTLQGHSFDTSLYRNGRLQASWAGQTFTKAAELVRYSGAGWSPTSVDRFEQMLRTAFLPLTRDGGNGCANCQLSMAEATTSIGVFLDDRAVFDEGISDWRAQLPAAFYSSSDGAKPVIPPGSTVRADTVDRYWKYPARYVDGLGAETCRDLGHTAMGLGAAFNTAATAHIQGLDLYGEQQDRLVAALELNSRYLVDPGASGWVCPAPPATGGSAGQLTGWVGFQHYTQVGVALPETARWLSRNEPSRTGIFMNWESLTHGS